MTTTSKSRPGKNAPAAPRPSGEFRPRDQRGQATRTTVSDAPAQTARLAAIPDLVRSALDLAQAEGRGVWMTIRVDPGDATGAVQIEDRGARSPANIEAEQALLGILLYDNDAFAQVRDQIDALDFYEPFHQRLFAHMAEQVRAGRLAEPIRLAEQFARDPAFEELGGIRYLADLVDRAPPSADAGDYARLLRLLALQRRERRDANGDDLDAAMSEAHLRGATRAAEILAGPDMLGADDFGRLIGMTREAVRQKLMRHEVLGLVGAKRGVRYPVWQVTTEGGLLPGLPALFRVLGDSPWTVHRFLTQPNPAFQGRPPLAALSSGQIEPVLNVAESHARGDFG